MTLEEQRKMLGADGDIERDCDRIAQEAARCVLDRTLFAPSVADLVGEVEELDLDDIDKQAIAKAIDLEREGEGTGGPEKMGELAAWMEYSQDFSDNEKDWFCAMLKWYAKAALAGVPAAISSIGRAFDGSFDEASMFADPEEENVDVEDERLIKDAIISAACELSAARRGDSYGLLQWYHHYMGWHGEKVCGRNFDKAMEYLIQLVERDYKVNKGILHDIWAHQGPHQLKLLVKRAPPESTWDDHEYPYIFGLCREHGWVLEKNLGKALDYYRKASQFGYDKAAEAVKRVEKEMWG